MTFSEIQNGVVVTDEDNNPVAKSKVSGDRLSRRFLIKRKVFIPA